MLNRALTQRFHQVLTGVVFLFLVVSAPALKAATPTVNPPYTMTVFATSTKDYTQPDSIVQWHDRIIIGYSNGVKKDGSDGKSSTIVEYSFSGKFIRSFSVPGHNDGLRVIDGDNL